MVMRRFVVRHGARSARPGRAPFLRLRRFGRPHARCAWPAPPCRPERAWAVFSCRPERASASRRAPRGRATVRSVTLSVRLYGRFVQYRTFAYAQRTFVRADAVALSSRMHACACVTLGQSRSGMCRIRASFRVGVCLSGRPGWARFALPRHHRLGAARSLARRPERAWPTPPCRPERAWPAPPCRPERAWPTPSCRPERASASRRASPAPTAPPRRNAGRQASRQSSIINNHQ